MKLKYFFTTLLLFPIFCFAQNNTAVYASSSLNIGNNIGLDLDLNFIFNNKYTLSTGIKEQLSINKDFPDDYGGDLDFFSDIESMNTFYLLGGVVHQMDNTVRFNLQGGIGSSLVYTQGNFVREGKATINRYEYSYDEIKDRVTSLILRPKLEITAPNVIGFYLYAELIANKYNSYYGAGIGIMFGKVR